MSGLGLDLIDGFLGVILDILNSFLDATLGDVVRNDSGDLGETNETEEEVGGGETIGGVRYKMQQEGQESVQVVLGLDDQAPSGPDETGAGQGKVLGEGELLDGSREVGDTGKDESPLLKELVKPFPHWFGRRIRSR